MEAIKIRRKWSFRTPETTIDYEAGEHVVSSVIAKQAQADGVIDEESPVAPGPLDKSVADLSAYLEGVDDLAEIVALIRAEEEGKTRATALTALQARKAALES